MRLQGDAGRQTVGVEIGAHGVRDVGQRGDAGRGRADRRTGDPGEERLRSVAGHAVGPQARNAVEQGGAFARDVGRRP